MNSLEYHNIYTKNHFFWNSEIAEFVQVYAGKNILSPNKAHFVRFCHPSYIKVGRQNRHEFDCPASYFGEDVAPVGDCNGPHTVLYLTESGKLFGFCDYLIIQWGDDPYWRIATEHLIAGIKAVEVCVLDE